MARERIQFQGLPARICWVGLGDRHRLGLAFNEMVAKGELKAPIVIGRDHLDSGSVASPNRETEAMRDGSDAVADWPLLNALLNTASGATWVSMHHGGGVGMGYSQHSGVVIVCDGTPAAARRIERVLWNDPATGVMRHADAGYEIAIDCAREPGARTAVPGRLMAAANPGHSNMTEASKLWRNARLATCDDSMRVIEHGAMITTGDRIAWIGPEAQIPAAGAIGVGSGAAAGLSSPGCHCALRGARRRRGLDHPGSHRLPHAPGVCRQPRRRVRATAARSLLRRDRSRRWRDPLHHAGGARGVPAAVDRRERAATAGLIGRRRHHDRDQVGLRTHSRRRGEDASGGARAGARLPGHGENHLPRRPHRAAGVRRPRR